MKYESLPFTGLQGGQKLELMIAESTLERMRGLLSRASPAGTQGMLLPACRLIHTFGMRYAIDVIYLDRTGRVVKVTAALTPGRIDGHWQARSVLEMGEGASAKCGITPGIQLRVAALGLA